jgi:tRNA threonylcarbamoyl adenosine modification protein YeaZ
MKILALEFSSAQRSVAIVQAVAGRAHAAPSVSEVVETGGRETKAIGMIEAALRDAQLEREQIDCIAVGLGPGSYAGIRAGIAFAQGWQLARDVKLLGISSVECIAEQARLDGLMGTVYVVIDAQRNEFYLGQYTIDEKGWTELRPLRLTTFAEVQGIERVTNPAPTGMSALRAGQALIGPEVTKWFAAGRIIFSRAAVLGQIALRRNDFVAGEKLEPIYLRETNFVKAPPPRIIPT